MGGGGYASTVLEGAAMDFLPLTGEPVLKVVIVVLVEWACEFPAQVLMSRVQRWQASYFQHLFVAEVSPNDPQQGALDMLQAVWQPPASTWVPDWSSTFSARPNECHVEFEQVCSGGACPAVWLRNTSCCLHRGWSFQCECPIWGLRLGSLPTRSWRWRWQSPGCLQECGKQGAGFCQSWPTWSHTWQDWMSCGPGQAGCWCCPWLTAWQRVECGSNCWQLPPQLYHQHTSIWMGWPWPHHWPLPGILQDPLWCPAEHHRWWLTSLRSCCCSTHTAIREDYPQLLCCQTWRTSSPPMTMRFYIVTARASLTHKSLDMNCDDCTNQTFIIKLSQFLKAWPLWQLASSVGCWHQWYIIYNSHLPYTSLQVFHP